MALARRTKDPQAVLDYTIDWLSDGWLLSGDTLSQSVWSADPGITIDSTSIDIPNGKTVVWLSGGTVGHTYKVTNSITTTGGRKDDRTLEIVVQER